MLYVYAFAAALVSVCIGIPLMIIIPGFLWGCVLALYNLWEAFAEAHYIEK